ncbi:MAG: ImmA/IrrE family metallo-endopeptidase [Vulcanibacillus sp.]
MPSRINKEPRYKRTTKKAQKFIIEQNINQLPVDPFSIAQTNGWKIEKVSIISKDLNISINKILNNLIKSNDGTAIYIADINEYAIIYNDNCPNKYRIRWTIMHEIGHIVLNHLEHYDVSQIARGGIPDIDYEVLEKEADFFAGLVLAPPVILHSLNIRNSIDIKNICKLSREASENRFKYYRKWVDNKILKSPEEIIIKHNFLNFLNRKQCLLCGHSFVSEKAYFCPICGEKLKWGELNMKYNDGYELDSKSKALTCPICKNESISEKGNFCSICGAYLVNECTNNEDNMYNPLPLCGELLEGNARFCHLCGSQSTFLKRGYLTNWEDYHKKHNTSTKSDSNIVNFNNR